METNCPCCGVKYSEKQEKVLDCYNFKRNSKEEYDFQYQIFSREIICLWCACMIPSGIVDMVFGYREKYDKYTISNFQEEPTLKKRIAEISELHQATTVATASKSCPACNGELFEQMSEYTNLLILKCKECGWC